MACSERLPTRLNPLAERTCFSQVPLIIAAPWLAATHGRGHFGMAEMTDFYRTLSDLAGIDPATVDKGVEGDSLTPAFADPAGAGKLYAFSQTQRIQISSLKTIPSSRPKDNP